MNYGAIKVHKSDHVKSLNWINANLESDYKVIYFNDLIYYIGKSSLFNLNPKQINTCNVYCVIISNENTFKLKLENWSYVKL